MMTDKIRDQRSKVEMKPDIDKIVLHTYFAKSLFVGSQKPGKFGLIQFANLVSVMSLAEKNDDPYAALFLIKIYQEISNTRKKIKLIEQNCQALLDGLRGFEITLFSRKSPMKYPIKFSNPFSYSASPIITDIDYVTRLRLTLDRIGMMIPEGANHINLRSMAQKVFSLPSEWKQLNIKRSDIVMNNDVAQNARELWGEIPDAVLNKEIKFSFLSTSSR